MVEWKKLWGAPRGRNLGPNCDFGGHFELFGQIAAKILAEPNLLGKAREAPQGGPLVKIWEKSGYEKYKIYLIYVSGCMYSYIE